MGDKPQRFIGSKQWIGAMEAQMLLDQYLGPSLLALLVQKVQKMTQKTLYVGV
jgi:hypothetical protein